MPQKVIKKSSRDNENIAMPSRKEFLKLQAAQENLQERAAAMEKNEQRLAALNAISGLITQSLEIRDVLTLVADKVKEVMEVDVIMIFLLDE